MENKLNDTATLLNIEVKYPIYFLNKNLKIGKLCKLATVRTNTTFSVFEKNGSRYVLQRNSRPEIEIELKTSNGDFKPKGVAINLTQNQTNFSDNFKINGSGKNGWSLRPAQKGAIYALLSHWSLSNDVATIVLPTGTGKTETMLSATIADNAERTLVVVPTIDLKNQIAEKFATWGILRDLGVIGDDAPNPTTLVLSKTISSLKHIEDFNKADVVITTPAFIARAPIEVLKELAKIFSHVFFDEAHHIQAKEWGFLKSLFKNSKIVQFTATPYRNDRKPIEGKVIYNYPLSQALVDKCFSKISLVSIEEKHPKKKDKAIADAAHERLLSDREKGWTQHKMMVRAEEKKHAEQLYKCYKEWFPEERVVLVHSQTKQRKKIVREIKEGKFDIIICVDMLKEGFDYPDFKIAAVHGVHKSLSVLLQFIGRFTRTSENLGDASFVVNYAEETISIELENLFQEGSGWENVISEIADARKQEAESLLSFLQGCKPFTGFDSPDVELNPKLVYPALSCVCFKTVNVNWNNFKDAFSLKKYHLSQPYINEKEDVFYFTVQKREKVKWARTENMKDQTWNLVVMHFNKEKGLLFVGYSEKRLDLNTLIKKISGDDAKIINGDSVFRSFDSIKRLSIVHAGIFRPANHLHRYSRLSGADVTKELTRWKQGNRCEKSDFVGIGFRDGFPVSVGASVKGKIWSPARVGDLKEWKDWCLKMGDLITDETINSDLLLENSAEKYQLEVFPTDLVVLATDWAEELYDRIHRITLELPNKRSFLISECELKHISTSGIHANFRIVIHDQTVEFSIELNKEKGHLVKGLDDSKIEVEGLKSNTITLKKFFEENPPTMFLLDGCTISGSIYTDYGDTPLIQIPDEQIHSLSWNDVNYQFESLYKGIDERENSIQEFMMKKLVERGAKIVFNDDNSGESADVVAIFLEDSLVRFELVHCKYSSSKSGSRLGDLYEVCGQAIVSLRYKWKPEELLKHMERRNSLGVLKHKRFYFGSIEDLEFVKKAIRYSDVQFEFAIAQPGVKTSSITTEMKDFLGSLYSTVLEMTETQLKCYFNMN
jgi:superfamily II DNA or RNA helicase